MPRLKHDQANHLAASMDARMVKSARLITNDDIGYHPDNPDNPDDSDELISSEDEEGMTGEECLMTGKPIWECDCPDCVKKVMESEEGMDDEPDLSVEEELMRFESKRVNLRKRADVPVASPSTKQLQADRAVNLAVLNKALIVISAKLDKAGLDKSAYATLRTLQVLQKEIK